MTATDRALGAHGPRWAATATAAVAPVLASKGSTLAPVVDCAGLPVTIYDLDAAASLVVRRAVQPAERGYDVHLCNAYTIACANRDPLLHGVLAVAALNLADGVSVSTAARMLGRRRDLRVSRVPGPDLFLEVFRRGQEVGLRHYLLGSTPDTLDDLSAALRRRFPEAIIVAAESPPFRPLDAVEVAAQVDRIKASGAHLVWVGLGTPKQNWVTAELARELPIVAVGVGAAFDFVAERIPRAPRWMRALGLEWLARLLLEPRRLWRRYLIGTPEMAWAVFRWARIAERAKRARGDDNG